MSTFAWSDSALSRTFDTDDPLKLSLIKDYLESAEAEMALSYVETDDPWSNTDPDVQVVNATELVDQISERYDSRGRPRNP